jgi:phospholipid/cholesterol/gamma-HCH transport system permease protein
MAVATIEAVRQSDAVQLVLSGEWTLATMPQPISGFELRLRDLAISKPGWDLRSISRLDSAGAILLWRAWGRQWPASLAVSSGAPGAPRAGRGDRPDLQPEPSAEPLAWLTVPGRLACPLATIWRRWLP